MTAVRHELHLARVGFLALAAIGVLAAAIGAVVDGNAGAWSAAIGVGLVAANHAIAVASTSWAKTIAPRVIAVSYSVFVVRMMLLLGTFGTLGTLTWIHDTLLAGSFCAALVASLSAECWSYVRGSYVPSWRTR